MKGLAATAATSSPALVPTAHAAGSIDSNVLTLGKPQAFDYAWLKGRARELAQSPYKAPDAVLPRPIANMDYDQFQSIRFRPEHSLWAKDDTHFRVQFFHPGFLFKERVKVFEVVNGQAQELAYDPAMFDLKKAGVSGSLPRDLGFAGLRIQHHYDWSSDIASFLGASYFRAVGADRQYGLSTRGLAIDSGSDKGEEFPRFTTFWLERPAAGSGTMTVYALLDSPSITGAYRVDIRPGGAMTMEVDSALYPRKAIDRLGIAPLTSMYLYGENDRRMATDWRPEIHDSDGLSMQTGAGEWLWRPLTNPAGVRLYSYLDKNPLGFGLMQRDRDFNNYQDDGVFYERRPSLWVKPKSPEGWKEGSVSLLELPAPDETYDNIVAAWIPSEKPKPGQELLYSYQLQWGVNLPQGPVLAKVVATRTGIGGVVGQKRKYFSWRFAVDFHGGAVPSLIARAKENRQLTVPVDAVVSASRGKVEIVSARPLYEINGYRAMFDLRTTDERLDPIDLRLYLRMDGEALSETWLYQWVPPSVAERKRFVEAG